jgi:uncharacterized protein YyaL (SSP411 family)
VTNRLAAETSPYLLQHGENPVDWYPWGPEAIARARELDRPLLVSIGYSACHWCHVMAHESFEDPGTAAVMNELFVPVKVDREERPDIDAMCMDACQTMTGQGGWPLHAFLTPDLVPFFTGTYFPPEPRHGMPSWQTVLEAVARAWQERREEIERQGSQVAEALGATARLRADEQATDMAEALAEGVSGLGTGYDDRNGGWGRAPKFPPSQSIELLLARDKPAPALHTLRSMAVGGIFDQLAGGFCRYSVDATWTVPHFEKMLYDNALLASAYLHGWQASGDERLAEVCRMTLDWVLTDLRGPEGGFCSALDADSEGVEGRFYVWSEAELRSTLGDLYEPAMAYFRPQPFEHALVLEARGERPDQLPEIRRRLLAVRSHRIPPGLDDKRLTGWNALMIAALAQAGAALGEPRYLSAARQGAEFILGELRDGEGRLLRSWKDGQAKVLAFLDDHAFLLAALLDLYEASFEARWYHEAIGVADALLARFADTENGGFFTTSSEHEVLPVRRKDLEDSPVPSGNSAAALALLRLARLSGESRYERAADGVLALLLPLARRHPHSFGHLLRAADFATAPVREVAIVGPEPEPLLAVIRERLHPHLVLAGGEPDGVPLLADRPAIDGRATAYVCEHFSCRAPVTEPAALAEQLEHR